ncbi:hypothetical protein QQ045_004685 [Rhodiola kirilowii]
MEPILSEHDETPSINNATPSVVVDVSPTVKSKLTSVVWNHFKKLDEEVIAGKKVQRAKCNICNVTLICSGTSGTSHLSRHAKTHASAHLNASDIRSQMLLAKDRAGMLSTYAFDNKKARLEIVEYLIRAELPFTFVDSHDFAGMIQRGFAPQFKKSSAQTFLALHEQSYTVATSLPIISATRNFPSSVLSQGQRDDHRPSMILVKEETPAQVMSGDSDQYEKDFDRQLLHWPGLCYLLPPPQNQTKAYVSLTTQSNPPAKEPKDFELSDAVILAEKALSASKEAAMLANNLKLLGAEFDSSRSPTEVSVCSADHMVEKVGIVRSTRTTERQSKRRGPKKLTEVTEIPDMKKIDVKRKISDGFDQSDPLRLFLSGPETKQLLTAKEESDLISQIQVLARLEDVKHRLQSHLTREPTLVEWSEAAGVSNWVLQSHLRSGNRSREKLINANFRLVVHIAKSYQGRGLSLQDLLQEGSRGLMRSVEKFKPQAGCRFATYAYWWIRQSIRKSIFQHSRTIRLPDNVYSLLGKVLEAKKVCIQEGHSRPTKEQIAGRVGITVQKLEGLMHSARIPVSMQQTVWADQDTTYQEITADNQVETPDMSVAKQMMRRHVRGLLSVLSPKERKIIKLRFGIEDGKPRTLSEIGNVFGLSKERVRQLESRAFYKLKRTLDDHGLDAYADLLM